MSDYDYSMAIAASIQFYLFESLQRDQIRIIYGPPTCAPRVTPAGDAGYKVSFYSPDPRASAYGSTHISWLKNGREGLNGVLNCQGDKACWEPTGKTDLSGAVMTCLGPWQFYLPLGLPMVSQKMVMLLHYPPYVSMQQSDYLNNATLNRWRRLLETVGVASDKWTLYTAIVDAFPIAAPGSGQTGCFPATTATKFFGNYIQTMLNALVTATAEPANPDTNEAIPTVPVIIYGGEARGVWNSMYPNAQTDVLKAGNVMLDGKAPVKMTPYIGANHPIAAVYQDCSTEPTIVTMAKQDLTTACFVKTMAAAPNADPVAVAAACKDAYFSSAPDHEHAAQICVTAVMDKSPRFVAAACTESYFSSAPEAELASQICINADVALKNKWVDFGVDKPTAQAWCEAHNNAPCPARPWGSAAP
jgi:hypothetical protein